MKMMSESNLSTIPEMLPALPSYSASPEDPDGTPHAPGSPDVARGRDSEPGEQAGAPVDLAKVYPEKPRQDFSPTTIQPVTSGQERKKQEYFVLRCGVIEQAVSDLKSAMSPEEDGAVQSVWLFAEVDLWNNEMERLVVLTERSLLICKYDFIGLHSSQALRVSLRNVDTIFSGEFSFPGMSLSKREGRGLRIQWDRFREPSFLTCWNPWSIHLPFVTLTEHPITKTEEKVSCMCQLETFKTQLADAVQRVQKESPMLGRANGVLIVEQPIPVDTYVGLMSFLTKSLNLGYAKSRGHFGF
ncbi:tumor protein p63-regulated gene 1-like protein [Latimeria chalumnae]|uniref:tumor protein p63-regulated gene 1-like protein n=1 Tax=Latimeria chalumnae TaxID=7897 RepID=UPI00313D6E91